MFSFAMRTMLDATSSGSRPSSVPSCVESRLRAAGMELQPAAEEELGVQPAEREVGVRERRLLAALAVAGRTGIRARALRPDLQEAARVLPSDRAAARADRLGRHPRHADGEAVLDLVVGGIERLAVHDEADVAARSAHIEHDRLPRAGAARVPRAADGATGDSGEEEVSRAPAGLLAERVSAVRLEQRAGRSHGTRREGRLEPGDVVVEERLQVGVDDHGRAALVLAPDRRDLVRQRYGRPVVVLQQLAGGELVGRLEVREQVADGDRGSPAVQVSARELLP